MVTIGLPPLVGVVDLQATIVGDIDALASGGTNADEGLAYFLLGNLGDADNDGQVAFGIDATGVIRVDDSDDLSAAQLIAIENVAGDNGRDRIAGNALSNS